MTTVDVIVPVYGHWEMVQRCIAALIQQTVPVRIIVVDDYSPDETADRIARNFPDVDLIRQHANSGFAAACNAGYRQGVGDVVVLVNSDVEAEPSLVEALLPAFDDAAVASAVPVLTRPDGRLDAVGICADRTLAGFVRFHGASPDAASRTEPPVLGPYGAVAAYRRVSVPGEALFDDGIFMYGEELDLALRLRAAGHITAVVPDARAMHLGGVSAGKGSSKQRYLAGYGRGYILAKYRVLGSRFGLRAALTELLVSGIRLARRRDSSALRGRLAGYRAGLKQPAHPRPVAGLDPKIGLIRSLRMRSPSYWAGM